MCIRDSTCTEKCQAGAVNTTCPVCAVNMSECAGTESEVVQEPEPEAEPEKESGSGGALVLILLLAALGGGGAFAYIKFIKPKQGAKVSALLKVRLYLDKIKPNFEEGGKFHAFQSVFDGFETFLFVDVYKRQA